MTDITIPDEVVEPIAKALCVAEGYDPERLRLKSNDKLWTAWVDEARAAIIAALKAWPGMLASGWPNWPGYKHSLILPLTQETDA